MRHQDPKIVAPASGMSFGRTGFDLLTLLDGQTLEVYTGNSYWWITKTTTARVERDFRSRSLNSERKPRVGGFAVQTTNGDWSERYAKSPLATVLDRYVRVGESIGFSGGSETRRVQSFRIVH